MPFAAVDGLRVREALELPCFSGAVVIAGHEGLDRVVRHVTVVDTPGPYKWIRGDELLLTAAYFLKNEPEAQLSMIPELAPLGVAAIAMKLGRYVDYMPPAMIDHADRYGLPLIELPYEVAWIDIINPVMAEILNRQASILKESKQSHEMLMKLVLDGCGLPEIATRLSSLIDRPVTITDQQWNLIATSPRHSNSLSKDAFQPDQGNPKPDNDLTPRSLAALGPEDLRQAWRSGTVMDHSVLPNLRVGNGLIIVPVLVGEKVYAYIVVSEGPGKLSALNLTTIENASTVCAVEILRIRASHETQRHFRNDFVSDLVSGDFESLESITRRAEAFDWNLSCPHILLNVDIDSLEKHYEKLDYDNKTLRSSQENFIRIVESAPTDGYICRKLVGAGKANRTVVLLSFDEGVDLQTAKARALRIAEYIRSEAEHHLNPITVSIGVSRIAFNVGQIQDAHKQAIQALTVGRQIFGANRVIHFDELGIFRIICEGLGTEEHRMFHEEWVQPIVEYDEERGTNLVGTLNAYFMCNMSVVESAEKLYIHENTLRYRLSKVESILGKQLSSGETALNLWLALKVHLAAMSLATNGNRDASATK